MPLLPHLQDDDKSSLWSWGDPGSKVSGAEPGRDGVLTVN